MILTPESLRAVLAAAGATADADFREVYAARDAAAIALAAASPEELLAVCEADPLLLRDISVVAALGHVPGATDLLVAAARAPFGPLAQRAIDGLVRAPHPAPAVVAALRHALGHGDPAVAKDAARHLADRGVPSDTAALRAWAARAPGAWRDDAWDAIEAISARHAVPLPADHPRDRRETVHLDEPFTAHLAVTLRVEVGDRVLKGQPVAAFHGDFEAEVPAPCDGEVLAVHHERGRVVAVTLRRGVGETAGS